jgi:hypothetical protein
LGKDQPYEVLAREAAAGERPCSGNERHDVRVKVCRVHGLTLQWNNAADIAVRPQPPVAAGHLAPDDFDAVSRWIVLNEAVLVAYWEGTIGTVELVQRLRPLSPVLP